MRHGSFTPTASRSLVEPFQALNSICDHVDDIESVLRTELESGQKIDGGGGSAAGRGGVIKRDAMARKLSRARGKEVRARGEEVRACVLGLVQICIDRANGLTNEEPGKHWWLLGSGPPGFYRQTSEHASVVALRWNPRTVGESYVCGRVINGGEHRISGSTVDDAREYTRPFLQSPTKGVTPT